MQAAGFFDVIAESSGSGILFFYKSFESLLGELSKFSEQGRFDFLEIETGFSLHVLL